MHYAEPPSKNYNVLPHNGMCGANVFTSQQWTSIHDDVTCGDCCIRLLAFFHRASAILMKNLAIDITATAAEVTELRGKARG